MHLVTTPCISHHRGSACLLTTHSTSRAKRASKPNCVVACTSSSSNSKDIIDGGNFVIKKTYTIHGNSFVMVRRAPGNLPPVQPRRRYGGVADLVPYQRAPPSLGSDLHVGDVLRQPMDISKFAVVMDTDVVLEVPDDAVEVLPDDYVLGGDDEEVQPSTNCTGIVWVGSDDMAQPTEHQWNDANPSPRRTSRLHFTCNMCGHRNEKLINPRAWEEGTVFARCDGCSVVHKLKDNLNLIDEIVYNRDEEEDGDDDQHPGITATSSASPEVDDATAAAYSQGLPRTPFVVGDLVVPPGLVVEPEDPLCN